MIIGAETVKDLLKKRKTEIICSGGNWLVCCFPLSRCSLMFFLHSNPLKALSQTALTSTGQAFPSPENCLKEKNSLHFLCLVAVQVVSLEKVFSLSGANFEGF